PRATLTVLHRPPMSRRSKKKDPPVCFCMHAAGHLGWASSTDHEPTKPLTYSQFCSNKDRFVKVDLDSSPIATGGSDLPGRARTWAHAHSPGRGARDERMYVTRLMGSDACEQARGGREWIANPGTRQWLVASRDCRGGQDSAELFGPLCDVGA
ncbi:MAG TPA: hypothetical protein VKA15_19670, partial [Isosphaeraceae bacterium]|nr:hypothetical protein [Isosphaeraceae bacterium]